MKLKSIRDVKDLKGKRVLVRVAFNVPIADSKVVDDFRIRKALPTIQFLQKEGAKIILISHIGRKRNETLKPVALHLNQFIKNSFIPQVLGDKVREVIDQMKEGEVVVLEDLRQREEEIKNDESFSRELASLGDLYVNDAFAASHREHASIVGVPKFLPSYAGFQLEREIEHLGGVLENPARPFLFIIGGAKFATKMPLIEKFLEHADFVFVGGALANNFFKTKGYEIGRSLVDKNITVPEEILQSKKLILPINVVVALAPSQKDADWTQKDAEYIKTKDPSKVISDEMIVDVGEESLEELKTKINEAKLVVYNGPLGFYEHGFDAGTKKLLNVLAESDAKTIVGGGDTIAVISKLGLEEKFSFVSTGGGAMLEFLERGTLPGIDALRHV